MTFVEKAQVVKDDPETLRRFCQKLFELGRDWLDVETLMSSVGFKDDGQIYRHYEEWQNE